MPAPPDLLKDVPLFAGLSGKERKRLAAEFTERPFSAGDTLTAEGDGGVGFFVIERGEVRVTVGGEERRSLGAGDYFGEIALIDGGTRTATITALTDGVAFGLTTWKFRPLVQENASVAWPLLEAMARRLRELEQH